MIWREIHTGAIVYHNLFTHRGKGTVVRRSYEWEANGKKRIVVKWENGSVTHEHIRMLRKTPNRKKIEAMVKCYKQQGKEATDAGDRLILPK